MEIFSQTNRHTKRHPFELALSNAGSATSLRINSNTSLNRENATYTYTSIYIKTVDASGRETFYNKFLLRMQHKNKKTYVNYNIVIAILPQKTCNFNININQIYIKQHCHINAHLYTLKWQGKIKQTNDFISRCTFIGYPCLTVS